ncbi:MAG: metallophosphoesterase [Gammaproteobacteria bacterium]|nr:metallophosphoesterase family protein [Gammaproteobacteria bacterium]
MRLLVLSDLHLEHTALAPPAGAADLLVAAGDIGHGREGLDWLQSLERPVLYVAGNHEYWGQDLAEAPERLRRAAAGSAVRVLEQETAVVGGVRFLGCTLWGDYADGDPRVMEAVHQAMNDFQQIHRDGVPLTPDDLLEAHRGAREWIARTLAEPFDGPTVVVTHHAPSFRSWTGRADSPYRHACCADLEEVMARQPIALWIHGHLHHAFDYPCRGVRVLCNPRGYANDPARGFRPEHTVSV